MTSFIGQKLSLLREGEQQAQSLSVDHRKKNLNLEPGRHPKATILSTTLTLLLPEKADAAMLYSCQKSRKRRVHGSGKGNSF